MLGLTAPEKIGHLHYSQSIENNRLNLAFPVIMSSIHNLVLK